MKKWSISGYAIVIAFIMVLQGIFIIGMTKIEYEDTFREESIKEVAILETLLKECDYNYQQFVDVCHENQVYATIISSNGIVTADTNNEGVGKKFPRFNTFKDRISVDEPFTQDFVIKQGEYQTYGKYVEVDSQDGVYLLVKRQYAFDIVELLELCSVALLAIIACVLTMVALYKSYQKNVLNPIEKFKGFVYEVSKGNYGKQIDLSEIDGSMHELADSFNVMSKVLDHTVNEMDIQNTRLHTVLNNMTEGVLAIDNDNRIMLTNLAAHKLFGIDTNCSGKLVHDVISAKYVLRLIERAKKQEKIIRREMVVHFNSPQIINVSASQITDESDNVIGIILVVEDVTQIRRLEKMRTEFASNVSHELKTPLTSIIGFVDSLKNGALEDRAVASRFIDIIAQESDRLYRLIQDILEISSIEKSDDDYKKDFTNLKIVAEQVRMLLASKAEVKGISFEFAVDEELPMFYCNGDRFHQLFLNVCDNAIKYTEEGGVHAKLYKKDDELFFIVSDTGIGIPEQAKERIYERFYRVDKGRSREMGGTGLGLSIVKHIVLLYNGSIEIESEVGKGTAFIIKIPFDNQQK